MSDAWLKLLDQGNYSEAWDQTAARFKKLSDKDAWVKQLDAFRKSLGPVDSRTLERPVY